MIGDGLLSRKREVSPSTRAKLQALRQWPVRRAGQFEILSESGAGRKSYRNLGSWWPRETRARTRAGCTWRRIDRSSAIRKTCGAAQRNRRGSCGGPRGGKPGNWPRKRKRMPQRVAREIVNELRMPEAHFYFCGVNVHVYFLIRQIEKQQHHRKHAGRNDIAIGLANRVKQKPVAHQPPVHENVDSIAIRPLHFRTRRKSCHA